jgi:hypothetical protein
MPTRRMSRSLSNKYLSATRCINPGDPGCGRGPKVKSNRQLRKEQEEASRRVDEYLKEKEIMTNGIVKREYIEGIDVGPGANSDFLRSRQRRLPKELRPTRSKTPGGDPAGEIDAKKGTKLKAQRGIKQKKTVPDKKRKGLGSYEKFMRGFENMPKTAKIAKKGVKVKEAQKGTKKSPYRTGPRKPLPKK